jgi:hypothetical protein
MENPRYDKSGVFFSCWRADMPLTKKELIDMLYTKLDIPKEECINLVEGF